METGDAFFGEHGEGGGERLKCGCRRRPRGLERGGSGIYSVDIPRCERKRDFSLASQMNGVRRARNVRRARESE